MRILSAEAEAFGPLSDARLELARGMTVVHGPNESGKSSWHAALYAGLCGLRRGAGQRREDGVFRDRHKPWSGDDWRTGVRIELADGCCDCYRYRRRRHRGQRPSVGSG